jgi:hypothetical protein
MLHPSIMSVLLPYKSATLCGVYEEVLFTHKRERTLAVYFLAGISGFPSIDQTTDSVKHHKTRETHVTLRSLSNRRNARPLATFKYPAYEYLVSTVPENLVTPKRRSKSVTHDCDKKKASQLSPFNSVFVFNRLSLD